MEEEQEEGEVAEEDEDVGDDRNWEVNEEEFPLKIEFIKARAFEAAAVTKEDGEAEEEVEEEEEADEGESWGLSNLKRRPRDFHLALAKELKAK